jgi:hypothetical protein
MQYSVFCFNFQYPLVLILLYLSTAIGLPPGGSGTVHIYTQTIHRTTQQQNNTNDKQNNSNNKFGRVLAVPSLCEFYPGICLTTEGKARKNLSQGSRSDSQHTHNRDTHTLQNPHTHTHTHTLTHSLTHTLTHSLTHSLTHTHTHTHTMQKNIKTTDNTLKNTQNTI